MVTSGWIQTIRIYPIQIGRRGLFAFQFGLSRPAIFHGSISLVGIFVWIFVDVMNFMAQVQYRTQSSSDPLKSPETGPTLEPDPTRKCWIELARA